MDSCLAMHSRQVGHLRSVSANGFHKAEESYICLGSPLSLKGWRCQGKSRDDLKIYRDIIINIVNCQLLEQPVPDPRSSARNDPEPLKTVTSPCWAYLPKGIDHPMIPTETGGIISWWKPDCLLSGMMTEEPPHKARLKVTTNQTTVWPRLLACAHFWFYPPSYSV